MEQSKSDETLGRFLSLVLRHNPAAAQITLERIVRENSKQRYSFNGDHTKIRANQGHSIAVDVELRQAQPPARLYHGTAMRFLESIRAQGITRQSRQHVHLSADYPTALAVGSRHGRPVVLAIDAAAMARDGYVFYRSENGVWLCERVPWSYVLGMGRALPHSRRADNKNHRRAAVAVRRWFLFIQV